MRKQGKVLEHEPHAAPVGVEMRAVGAVDLDGSLVEALEAGDEPKSGGLAAATRADQGNDLAFVHVEAEVLDGRRGAVMLGSTPDA
jgi:hypothetical protein